MIKDNEKTFFEYGKNRIDKGINPKTVEIQSHYLKKFGEYLGNTSFKDATEDDIIQFKKTYAPSSQNQIVGILRKFYIWHFEVDKGDKLPKCIRNVDRISLKTHDIVYRERVITEDEYQRMIDNAPNPMHKAIIETLYIFGVRVSELLSMKLNCVTYDGKYTRIVVPDSKTIEREIPYNGRASNLMSWIETYHPFKDKKIFPLWVNTFFKTYEPFTRRGVLQMVNRVRMKAGIERKITNHDFRHTSISRDRSEGVPTTHIETKHGLVHGSLVMSTYDHNKSRDYEEWLDKKNIETPETYETLKKKTDEIKKQQKEIDNLKEDMAGLTDLLRTYIKKSGEEWDEDIDFEKHMK